MTRVLPSLALTLALACNPPSATQTQVPEGSVALARRGEPRPVMGPARLAIDVAHGLGGKLVGQRAVQAFVFGAFGAKGEQHFLAGALQA